jgi:hypothetical protein
MRMDLFTLVSVRGPIPLESKMCYSVGGDERDSDRSGAGLNDGTQTRAPCPSIGESSLLLASLCWWGHWIVGGSPPVPSPRSRIRG